MREDFENWLFQMDEALDKFKSSLPSEMSSKLDYSIDSLDVLEKWMLEKFDNHTELLDKKNKTLQDQISRYIGETFRKKLKCKWDIQIDDPKFAFYGLPILVEKDTSNTIVCPYTLSTTVISRKKHNFLSTILKNKINK